VSGGIFSIRIKELYDELRRDPFYGDEERVQELVLELKRKLLKPGQTFKVKTSVVLPPLPSSTEQKRFDYGPQLELIHILFDLAGLDIWIAGTDSILAPHRKRLLVGYLHEPRFYTRSDELKRLLRRLDLPLPESIFPSAPTLSSAKKLRSNQRHKKQCRAIAERLWKEDPTRTIQDVILSDEITENGCEGKIYGERTLRNWINDLCPNRRPGRRPKSQVTKK
jgi:hypothetical protein